MTGLIKRILALFVFFCLCNIASLSAKEIAQDAQDIGKDDTESKILQGAANEWLPKKAILAKDSLNFFKRLEPRGRRILHGVGQSEETFVEYSKHFKFSKPLIYMAYTSLNSSNMRHLQRFLENEDNRGIIPQIGLSFMNDRDFDSVYLLKQSQKFVRKLQQLNRPAFVRLGYEFNGEWNHYTPENYKATYQFFAKAIRTAGLDSVALVWCYAVEGMNQNWMDYYPGDEWVDWWGIDLFSPEHFTAGNTRAFIKMAQDRKYPVMLGESSPRWVGARNGEYSWRTWFVQLLKLFAHYPNVKAFCYISYNWADYFQPQSTLHDWGDARIWLDPVLKGRWGKTLKDPVFVNAVSRDSLSKILILNGPNLNFNK